MIRNPRLQLAVEIAREAGALTLSHFQDAALAVDHKADQSPVTLADRNAETHLRRRIAEAYPEDGILGEEFGAEREGSAHTWILDPIDGTRTFVRGVPLYGVMIAVRVDGVPTGGVIHMPALRETVCAWSGEGAWWLRDDGDPVPARVSTCDALDGALFCTTKASGFAERNRADAYRAVERAAGMTRTWGDCYGYVLVATGRAEVMIDAEAAVWDLAPVLPILAEAGGRFTSWSGEVTAEGGDGVGTNGRLHPAVLELLRA